MTLAIFPTAPHSLATSRHHRGLPQFTPRRTTTATQSDRLRRAHTRPPPQHRIVSHRGLTPPHPTVIPSNSLPQPDPSAPVLHHHLRTCAQLVRLHITKPARYASLPKPDPSAPWPSHHLRTCAQLAMLHITKPVRHASLPQPDPSQPRRSRTPRHSRKRQRLALRA